MYIHSDMYPPARVDTSSPIVTHCILCNSENTTARARESTRA